MGKISKLVQKAQKVNASVLEITTINNTGLASDNKRTQIMKWMEAGDRNVMIVTETLLVKEHENTNLFYGYECSYSSLHQSKASIRNNNPHDLRGKWGVAIITKDSIRIGKRLIGEGILEGRVVAIETFYTYKKEVKPLWLIGVYVPVERESQPAFYESLNNLLSKHVAGATVIAGDFNGHMEECEHALRNYETDNDPNLPYLRTFVKDRFVDTMIANNRGLIGNYTFSTRDGGYKTRLDYQFVNNAASIMSHEVHYDSVFTSAHYPVVVKYNLKELINAKKVTYETYLPDKAMCVDLREEEKIDLYHEELNEWRDQLNSAVFEKVCNYTPNEEQNQWMLDNLDKILESTQSALVDRAREVWSTHRPRRQPYINKDIGEKLGQLNWLRIAGRQLAEAASRGDYSWGNSHVLEGYPELGVPPFDHTKISDENERHEYYKLLYTVRREIWLDIRAQERKWKKERKKSWQSLIIREGHRNSSLFRQLRFKQPCLRDGDLVLDKNGVLLDKPVDITDRYREYYGELLGNEEAADTTPEPGRVEEQDWWDEDIIKEHQKKIEEVGGHSDELIDEPPSIEEYFAAVDSSKTNARGGFDNIQFGPIQAANFEFHRYLYGLIKYLWCNFCIPELANMIELVSIPKKGPTFDLSEKRGIGLASKYTLILEGIFIARLQRILERAGV